MNRSGTTPNWCDYDKITLYNSGEFNVKYKTDLNGKLKLLQKQDLPKQLVDSFLNGKYETYETLNDLVLYRTFGKYIGKDTCKIYGADTLGAYATTEFAESIIDVKIRLALLPEWKNTKMYEMKFNLPKGSVINLGIAGPQPSDKKTYAGGAEQIILSQVDQKKAESWALGYRRISARQLTEIPSYPFESVDKIVETMNLYPVFCPKCQLSDIHKVDFDEKDNYTFTGCHGGVYTMQYHCLNAACNYLW